jgi:hypothetical protein
LPLPQCSGTRIDPNQAVARRARFRLQRRFPSTLKRVVMHSFQKSERRRNGVAPPLVSTGNCDQKQPSFFAL